MKTTTLKGNLRKELGKKATKALRAEGNVPCVIYGGGSENVHFYAEEKAFKNIIYTADVFIVEIQIGDKTYPSVIREVQFHPVKDTLFHVDFQQVIEDKPIAVRLPIRTEGFAQGIRAGGRLKIEMRKVSVKGLVKNLPDAIVLDIVSLNIGDSIRVKALAESYPEIEFLNPPNAPVIQVVTTRVARSEATASEQEKGEEESVVENGGEGEEG